jgi:exosome complex RNA-binding protein Rrp4
MNEVVWVQRQKRDNTEKLMEQVRQITREKDREGITE